MYMHMQVAVDQLSMLSGGRNCAAFVQVESEVVCSPEELEAVLDSSSNYRYM